MAARPIRTPLLLIAAALASASTSALGQLRVVNWNVTNYAGGRISEFQTSIYGEFEGRSMAPDVLIGQEFISADAVAQFVTLLNTAPGSPGDWAAAPFINGPDTDNAFFYRTGKVQFLGVTTVAIGGAAPNHPRNVERYDIRPIGYDAAGATIACYSSHMKAQDSGTSDDSRRLLEAQRIRDNAESLPAGWNFILGGDFNIQTSSEPAYQELVGGQPDNRGRLTDPINSAGTWNNNFAFRFIHTQDPSGAGGMDDRHDQLLLSAGLVDGDGFDYIGDPTATYSTTTWDDPNHSYRAWGNDGTTFNAALRIAGNTMVGPAIAEALRITASGGGHLPVFLDLRVPPEISSPAVVNFGTVMQGAAAEADVLVTHAGDVALWAESGLAELVHTLSAPAGFSAPAGPFTVAPGGQLIHTLTMDTSTLGPVSGVLTIESNAPDTPAVTVQLVGNVIATCPADFNGDGKATVADFTAFRAAYLSGDAAADYNGNGTLGVDDFSAFRNAYLAGCQ